MTLAPLPQVASSAPVIQNRKQLEVLVENILDLQAQWRELKDNQEKDLFAIREKYRTPLAEVESFLTKEMAWAEAWAQANPAAFSPTRVLACAGGTLGFRVLPPRVERASRKWTWSAIVQKLQEASWGARYLRVPAPEVDKEALFADREKLSPLELRLAGLKIVQGERFFIAPTNEVEKAQVEPEWEEAA